jgi:hypothetical protein
MSDNLSVLLWVLIVEAVWITIPDGVSYRELQAVNFYDRTYKRVAEAVTIEAGEPKKVTGAKWRVKGAMRRFFHNMFFSGLLVSIMFGSLFVGLVPFWYYQQPTEWYDVIMALSVCYVGLLRLLPWIFVMTDDNFYTRTWIAVEALKSNNKLGSEYKDPEQIVTAKRTMALFSLLVLLTVLSALVLLCINKGDITDWTIYVSIVFYALSLCGAIAVFGIFFDIYYFEKKSSKKNVEPLTQLEGEFPFTRTPGK